MEGFTEDKVRQIMKIPKRLFFYILLLFLDIRSHRLFPLGTRRAMLLCMILRASLPVLVCCLFNARKGRVR